MKWYEFRGYDSYGEEGSTVFRFRTKEEAVEALTHLNAGCEYVFPGIHYTDKGDYVELIDTDSPRFYADMQEIRQGV